MFNQSRRTTTTTDTATDADRRARRRPSAAIIVSSLALFTALSGGAYAATTIGSLQIKDNAVKSIDIKNNDVRSTDIQNGTIKTADMSVAARLALKRKAGPAGPAGLPGAPGAPGVKGDTGDKGDPGMSGLVRVVQTTADNSDSPKAMTVNCPAGKKVVGTGFDINDAVSGFSPNAIKSVAIDKVSVPGDLSSATFAAYEQVATVEDWTLTGYVLCASVG